MKLKRGEREIYKEKKEALVGVLDAVNQPFGSLSLVAAAAAAAVCACV